jgi:hypothetical protein
MTKGATAEALDGAGVVSENMDRLAFALKELIDGSGSGDHAGAERYASELQTIEMQRVFDSVLERS